MGKAELKVPGGKLIRADIFVKDGRIGRVVITGDFFLHPEDLLEQLEEKLLGSDKEKIDKIVGEFFIETRAVLVGVDVKDFADVVLAAWED
ncbi:MAG: lipoate protein ligase C-terminal domain-containing protein [Candidatus Hodarchaeota archaeon]